MKKKQSIATSVVKEIHGLNPPGRFLKKNKFPSWGWVVVEDDNAIFKTVMAFPHSV
jgi:hypothetical protein